MSETYGQSDILNIAKKYTDDIEGLIGMLDLAYPRVFGTNLKARIARIKKRLINSSDISVTVESENESLDVNLSE